VCPSRAVNEARLEGVDRVVGKRAEAQMGLVVNGTCGDDDMVCGGGQMPRVRPHSLRRRPEPSSPGECSRPEYQDRDPKKGMVVVRVQGGVIAAQDVLSDSRRAQ